MKKLLTVMSLILIVALAFSLAACNPKTPDVGTDTATAEDNYYDETYGNYTITVYLIIGNPDPDEAPLYSGTVTLQTIKHMAYEAVEAACEAKSIDIVGLNGYSSFIVSLAGVGYVDNGDGTYSSWSTTINGQFSAGVGAQQLRDGDLFEVQYVTKEKTW